MHSQIIERIVEKLDTNILEKKGDFVVFKNDKYKPVRFDKANFKEIPDKEAGRRIAFVDGGNAELIKANNISLQFIRIACVVYGKNKRAKHAKKEFYLLAYAKEENGKIFYDAEAFGEDAAGINFKKIDSFDSTLRTGDHRIDISKVGEIYRRFAEIRFCGQMIDELSDGDIIVKDGDLECSITDEAEQMDALYKRAVEKGIVICGLAKTSSLLTNTGNSASAVIDSIGPESSWYYYPVAEIKDDNHKADICFVKLNDASKHVFRFEIFSQQRQDMEDAICLLKNNSSDPVFLGYPYGLIEADRLGRVSNNDAEYLKTAFMAKAGKRFEKIRKYMASADSHSILDSIG